MIELKEITVLKQGKKLFETLDLTLLTNDHYVIQGPNGSGKTTLLEILAGKIPVASGEVKYDFIPTDLDWEQRHQLRQQKVHYIPTHALQQLIGSHADYFYQQRYYAIGDVNVTTVAELFGKDVEKLDTLPFPDNFNIKHLLPLAVTQLSNGQLKKILIVRNLLKEIPAVLLLDYPFEGLDQESRIELCNFIDHLAQTFAIQIILVDHYHELPTVINKRIVIDQFTVTVEQFKLPDQETREYVQPSSLLEDEAPVVELRDITIQYGSKKVIDSLTWRINRGERWSLTGRNGSGKTTLFSLIYADHPLAYSQQVYLFGKRRGSGESIWDIKKRINYLGPEHIHFLSPRAMQQTSWEYLGENKSVDLKLLESALKFFNIRDLKFKPVRSLSSGELQLLLLIQFFSIEKELLLLDEPFQFLDPAQKDIVHAYLNFYLGKKSTLIMITHYAADVERWTQLSKRL